MPFFSKNQIDYVLNALGQKLPLADNPNLSIIFAGAFSEYGAEPLSTERKRYIETVEYISNRDLGLLVDFLVNHCKEINADAIKISIDSFLLHYIEEYKPLRQTIIPEKFKDALTLLESYLNVAWSKRWHNQLALPLFHKLFSQTIQEFLYNFKFDFNDLNNSDILDAVATQAVLIVESIFKDLNITDQLREMEKPKDAEVGEPISEEKKEAVKQEFQSRLKAYLEKNILPKFNERTVQWAKEKGIDIRSQSPFELGEREWMQDSTVKKVLKLIMGTIFPNGLPKGVSYAEPFFMYDSPEIIHNNLRDAFKTIENNGTVYVPLNIGSHWVFLSIQKTIPQKSNEKVHFLITYIDFLSSCRDNVIPSVVKTVQSLFPEADVQSNSAQTTKTQTDNYTCADRTMAKMVEKMLEQSGQTAELNPWAHQKEGSKVRRVTLDLLDAVRPQSVVNSVAPTEYRRFVPRTAGRYAIPSWFDTNRGVLAFLFLLMLGGIVLGGFGIGALAGSALIAKLFMMTAGPMLQTIGFYGLLIGFGSALCLFAVIKQGLSNVWEDLKRPPVPQVPRVDVPTASGVPPTVTPVTNNVVATPGSPVGTKPPLQGDVGEASKSNVQNQNN